MARRGPTRLEHLDDGLLLLIMRSLQPLPDLFNLARTSTRMKRLAHDRQHWLVVVPPACGSVSVSSSITAPNTYRTLACAVAAARPGDTVLLLPGTHLATHTVVVDKALLIVGRGAPEAVQLVATPASGGPVLDVRATCRVSCISMRSPSCLPCVLHRAGQMQLDQCHLSCDARGLAHLCAPLVTLAGGAGPVASPLPPAIPSAPLLDPCALSSTASELLTPLGEAGGAAPAILTGAGTVRAEAPSAPEASPPPPVASTRAWQELTPHLSCGGRADLGAWQGQAAPGRVTVSECVMEGGARAVLCQGGGEVQSVRVILLARRQLMWLDVDCRAARSPLPTAMTTPSRPASGADAAPAATGRAATTGELTGESASGLASLARLLRRGGNGEDFCAGGRARTPAGGGAASEFHARFKRFLHQGRPQVVEERHFSAFTECDARSQARVGIPGAGRGGVAQEPAGEEEDD